VFELGQVGDTFYIIINGTVDVYIPDKSKRSTTNSEIGTPKSTKSNSSQKVSFPFVAFSEALYKKIASRVFDPTEGMVKIASLSVGSSFGDLALVNNKPRTATIICSTTCEFATMNK